MVNKVILVGNVGLDPEVRSLENGTKVARVRLATTERMFDRQANETKEHTEWHTITLWRGLADVVDRYVRKGSQIYVEGRLRTREWTDKDGNKRYTTEILADTMNLLGRRGDNNAVPDGGYGQQQGGGQYGQSSNGGQNGGSNYGGVPQGAYGAPAQGGYQSPRPTAPQTAASSTSSAQPYSQQPAQAPAVAPSAPAEDPDDLPF